MIFKSIVNSLYQPCWQEFVLLITRLRRRHAIGSAAYQKFSFFLLPFRKTDKKQQSLPQIRDRLTCDTTRVDVRCPDILSFLTHQYACTLINAVCSASAILGTRRTSAPYYTHVPFKPPSKAHSSSPRAPPLTNRRLSEAVEPDYSLFLIGFPCLSHIVSLFFRFVKSFLKFAIFPKNYA